jgi:methylenetetrahydrofolate reductase (NADPH)
MAHLTCVSSTKETVKKQLECMQEAGIENVLALRGDIPADAEFPLPDQFHYAVELVRYIKQIAPEMCIGGACYPEGHPEAVSKAQDIQHIKEKVDAGCEFLTTQMFFDNSIFYNYMYRLREAGVLVPVMQGSCRLRVKIKWDAVFNCLAVVFLRDSNPSLTGLEMIRPK